MILWNNVTCLDSVHYGLNVMDSLKASKHNRIPAGHINGHFVIKKNEVERSW